MTLSGLYPLMSSKDWDLNEENELLMGGKLNKFYAQYNSNDVMAFCVVQRFETAH